MGNDQLVYIGQKALIRRGEEILVLIDPSNTLDLPGGKLQEGETDYKEALQREVLEETNLEIEVGGPICSMV